MGMAAEPSREDVLDLLERNVRDYALFMLDPTGVVISWNNGAQRIKGYTAQEIIGKHFSTFYPAEDLATGKPELELDLARADGRVEDEGWRVRKDGSRFWANVVITALYDEKGRLRGFAKITRDMTDRRRVEEELRSSEERFRLLVQDVSDYAIFMLDATGHVISWNAGAQRIKGYDTSEIVGKHFSVFYPREDLAAGRPEHNLETALREGRVEDEGWRVRKDGSRFWANVVITALYDEQRRLRGFAKVTRDMTESREAERILNDRRRLLAHLVQAQEAERRRIAWELQEESLHELAAIAARRTQLTAELPEQYAAPLTELGEYANEIIERLRLLAVRLRPPGIERESLADALTEYFAEQATNSGLKFTVDDRLQSEPSQETFITIFRICQEALSNVIKHARAGKVEITLSSRADGVLTQVTDDGIGTRVPEDLHPGPEHFGVVEMRERAETVGGWWMMSPAPERGTQIEFWIPNLKQKPIKLS